MKKTFKERLEAGLKAMGYREVPAGTGSRKYTVFVKDDSKPGKLFVGKAGALRSGRTVSDSFSVGDPGNMSAVYQRILTAGDTQLGLAPANKE